MSSEQVRNEFLTLPVEGQRQATDFIAFLHQRYQNKVVPHTPRKPEITQEPFVGMWKDRAEMQDSTELVRGLHEENSEKNHHRMFSS